MPSDVKLNKAGDIVEVNSYGIVAKENVLDAISKITKITQDSKIDKVLVNTTEQANIPNAFELLQLVKSFPSGLSVAIIVNEIQPTFKDMHFVETAGVNRRLEIKQFTNREDALGRLNS